MTTKRSTGAGGASPPASRTRPREVDLRALLENASDLITTIDRAGTITFQSPSSRVVLGYEPSEVEGRKIWEFVHDEDQSLVADEVRRAFEQPESRRHISVRVRHRDDSWRHLESCGSALSGRGSAPEVVVNSRDVTDRIGMEEALRASERLYRAFFHEALSGNYVTSPEGVLLDCNPAFCRMFGFASVEQALGTDASALYRDPTERDRVMAVILSNGRADGVELGLRRVDGRRVDATAHVVGELTDDGRLIRLRGYLLDETARHAAEDQLRHAQRMEAVGRLAGGIAHDFNNLLTAILGHNEILLAKLDPQDPRHAQVREVRRAAERAATLTRQLLAFSRRQVMQPQVLDLNAVVADMESMLRRVMGEDLVLSTTLGRAVPAIHADAGQLEQVLMNLVVNARDAMPCGGRITIGTEEVDVSSPLACVQGDLPPGRYALLTVSDEGMGMDAQTLGQIFEPFFTTKGPGEGTGLGLSTVYGIVRQSGGRISVYSEIGFGTSFKIYLPAVVGAVPEPQAEPDVPAALPRGLETILLVEDEPSVAQLSADVLRGLGFRVLEAGGGEAALRILQQSPETIVDLLVTDVVMPEMGGRELAERFLRLRPKARVLFTSGYPDVAIVHMGMVGSGMDFLSKPFTPSALALKVRKVLDGGVAARE